MLRQLASTVATMLDELDRKDEAIDAMQSAVNAITPPDFQDLFMLTEPLPRATTPPSHAACTAS